MPFHGSGIGQADAESSQIGSWLLAWTLLMSDKVIWTYPDGSTRGLIDPTIETNVISQGIS
jgi:hypothetical protein